MILLRQARTYATMYKITGQQHYLEKAKQLLNRYKAIELDATMTIDLSAFK